MQTDHSIAQEIVENSPAIAIRVQIEDGKWKARFITRNVASLGYRRDDFLSGGVTWDQVIHPEDLAPTLHRMELYTQRGIDSYTVSYRAVKKSGESIWVSHFATVHRDEEDCIDCIDCVVSDDSQTHSSLEKISENYRRQTVLNSMMQAAHQSDRGGAVPAIISELGNYLGITRITLYRDDSTHTKVQAVEEWCNIGVPSLLRRNVAFHYEQELGMLPVSFEMAGMCTMDYQTFPGRPEADGITTAIPVVLGEEPYGFLCFDDCEDACVWDVDLAQFLEVACGLIAAAIIRTRHEERIERLAYTDYLTGLRNRYCCHEELERALQAVRGKGQWGYVLFIDLDDFKVVNDGYGHDYGDILLQQIAGCLRYIFGEEQVFRFGGDEFVVLVNWEGMSRGEVVYMIDDLMDRVGKPWDVLDQQFYCTLSAGVVCYPDDGTTVKAIVRNADIAMYQAKKMGKNSYCFYSANIDNKAMERAEMEHHLREAIRRRMEGFQVYYQPIVGVDPLRPLGAEALIRWHDKNGNYIAPDQFISLAEYLGLIVPIGEYVLEQAALWCRHVNATRDPHFYVTVNASIRQFQQKDFIDRVERILWSTGVDPANMVIEVTEGLAIQDHQGIYAALSRLQEMGLRIAMDDFGTGYSSLSNMRSMPIDIIKIDQSFIRDITVDSYSHSFVRMIVNLGHTMGRKVCVEGVETTEQWRYCSRAGADMVQGFLFSRPIPGRELEKLLDDSEHWTETV